MINRKGGFGLGSIVLIGFLYYFVGIDDIGHWARYLLFKGGNAAEKVIPHSVNTDRLEFEAMSLKDFDHEVIEKIAEARVHKKRVEKELSATKATLSQVVSEFERLDGASGSGSKSHDMLVAKMYRLSQKVESLKERERGHAEIIANYEESRDIAKMKAMEYQELATRSKTREVARRVQPSMYNPASRFYYADKLADKVAKELEKDDLQQEIRIESERLKDGRLDIDPTDALTRAKECLK